MAEPLKRTNLRSSPEDAAFYRKFHDDALSTLLKGTPREKLLKDLVDQGVPEKTADRIVIAVEQELALQTPESAPPSRIGKILIFVALGLAAVVGYIVWLITKEGTFHWRLLVSGGGIATIVGYRALHRLNRLRDETDLSSPPGPGRR